MVEVLYSFSAGRAYLLGGKDQNMTQLDIKANREEALTKAFASTNMRVCLAYLDLAVFYGEQAQKQALRMNGAAVQISRLKNATHAHHKSIIRLI